MDADTMQSVPVERLWPREGMTMTGTRACNCLLRHGIRTLAELTAMTPDDLTDIRNFGAECLGEVRRVLGERGLALRELEDEGFTEVAGAGRRGLRITLLHNPGDTELRERLAQLSARDVNGGFQSAQVAAEAGVSYRQLDHWVRQGYLRPINRCSGTGVRRRWPESEVVIARRMASLTSSGLSPAVAARYARDSWPDGEIAPGLRLVVSEESA